MGVRSDLGRYGSCRTYSQILGTGGALNNLYRQLGMNRILLVENDPWTRESLSLFFQIQGCSLHSAANGEEAAAALSNDQYDLILCEYWLPDMDGLSLLKLYGTRQPRAVKFLLTAYLTHEASEEVGRAGVHDVIRKPFTVERLEKSLQRHFRQTRGRTEEAVTAG